MAGKIELRWVGGYHPSMGKDAYDPTLEAPLMSSLDRLSDAELEQIELEERAKTKARNGLTRDGARILRLVDEIRRLKELTKESDDSKQ